MDCFGGSGKNERRKMKEEEIAFVQRQGKVSCRKRG